MVTNTRKSTGYWKRYPDGSEEWIETSNQPSKNRLWLHTPEGDIPPGAQDFGALGPPVKVGEEEPVAETEERRNPLISSKDLYETDVQWAEWWKEYSQTGILPIAPETERFKPYYEQFVKQVGEYELTPEAQEARQYREDIEAIKPFQVEGGYDIKAARDAGISEESLSRIFGENLPQPEKLTQEQQDYLLLFKEYQRTGGQLDWGKWLIAGTPLRPEFEYENYQEALNIVSDVYAKYPGYTLEEMPDTIAELQNRFNENPKAFLDDLELRTTPDMAEKTLQLLGMTEEGVLQSLDYIQQDERALATVKSVFPEFDTLDRFADFVAEDFGEFVSEIQAIGNIPEVKKLIEQMGHGDRYEQFFTMTPENLIADLSFDNFMETPEYEQYKRTMIEAIPRMGGWGSVGVDDTAERFYKDPELLRRTLITEGRNLDTERLVRTIYPDMPDWQMADYFSIDALAVEKKAAEGGHGLIGTFTAGVGDLVANTGAVFKWLGADGIGDKIIKAGQFMQVQAEPVPFEPAEFSWNNLFTGEFWATYGLRTLPTLMTLAIPGIGAYGLAGSVATKIGLGAVGRAVITGIGGAVLSRPMESALEAGAAYDEAVKSGLSHEEASRAADKVFKGNLWLAGEDALQLAAAFMPTPFGKAGASLLTRGLIKTASVGTKIFVTGLTEGGEELYQEMLQKRAMGDTRGFQQMLADPDMKMVFALGAAMGIGMGAGGDIIVSIQNKVKNQFTPEQQAQFNTDKADFIKQGFSEPVAEQKAIDNAIEQNPELEKIVQDAAKATETELTFDQLKPKDEAERVAFDNLRQKALEDIGIQYVQPTTIEEAARLAREAEVAPEVAPAVPEVPVAPREAELPTAINKIRQEHEQVKFDVAAIRSSLKGRTDLTAKLTRNVLTGTERELAIAERLLSRVETQEELQSERITQLQDRIKASQKLARAKVEEVAGYKQALTDFVNTLPQEVRGKMLASVKNVRTEQGLERATNRAIELAEQHNQKTLIAEIRKEIKKARPRIQRHILRGRFTPEVQERLGVIEHNLDMDRDAAREQMANNIQKYQDGELDYEEMLKANEALNFAGIEGMSSEELANTLGYIKILETIGRSERQAKQEANTERIRAIRENISNILTGGKGLGAEVAVVGREAAELKAGWWDSFVNWQYGIDELADKLSKLDTTSKPYQSAISKFVAVVHRATNRQVAGTKDTYNQVKKAVADVFNIKSNHDINQVLNGLDEEVNLGTFKLTNEYMKNQARLGKAVKKDTFTLKMTRDEMVAKYMQLQDPTLADTFTIGMGWSQEVIDAINNTMTEQEKSLANAFFGFYESYYQSVNEIYQDLYNVDMPHNARYSPIRREFESQITEQLLTFQDAAQYASVLNGSLKSRTKNIRPLRFNGATKILSNHIEQMEHFKAWALPMRDLRRVFMNKEIRQSIDQYHGRGINKLVDKFLNQMARGGVETAATNRVADYLRRAFTKSILAIKPVMALKQIPSLFAYVSEMNVTDFFSGIADYWKSPVANFKFLYNNSEFFRNRIQSGFERDIRAAMEKHGREALSGKGKFTDWFLLQIRGGDVFAVTQGMWVKYQAGLKQGLSQAEAIAEAENTTGRTQPSFGIDTLSAIQNGGSWLKLMTMFQNQPNKYFRIMGTNLRNFRYGRGSRAKAASTMLMVWVVLPCIFQFISDAFQWKPERQARAAILGQLNHILIAGQLIQQMAGWLAGENYDWEVSPVMGTINDIQAAFMKARKLVNQGQDPYTDIDPSDIAALIEFVTKAGGQVSGLPTPYFIQLEKLIRHKFEEGEELEIKDFLFSEWALQPPREKVGDKVLKARNKLGVIKEGQEEKALTDEPLDVYTTVDFFRELGDIHKTDLPQDILKDKKALADSKAWAELEVARSEWAILPNIPLYKINTDDDADTIINYYQQWQARQKIESLAELKEFDKLYPKAYLGNVSLEQYKLLVRYLDAEDKDAFFEAHKEALKVNPRDEWLRNPANARGAALLSLAGDAKVLSREAYNEFTKLITELDFMEDAIPPLIGEKNPFFQLPDESVDNYLKLQEILDQPGIAWNSAESVVIWANDDKLREFLEYDMPDKPLEYYQLKVDNIDLFNRYDEISADEIMTDDEKEQARQKLWDTKVDGKTFHDIWYAYEAMGKGSFDNPTPQDIVDAHVEYMRIKNQEDVLHSQLEANLFVIDNEAYKNFRYDTDIWSKDKVLTEEFTEAEIARMRLLVDNRDTESQYIAIRQGYNDMSDEAVNSLTVPEGMNPEAWSLKTGDQKRRWLSDKGEATFMADNPAYEQAYTKIKGYEFGFTEEADIDKFVIYNQIPKKGYRDERFMAENPDFFKAYTDLQKARGDDPLDWKPLEEIPSVKYDDLSDQWQEQLDLYDSYADPESLNFIEDSDERAAKREPMLFTEETRTYSGVRAKNKTATQFQLARYELDGYEAFIPDDYISDYVGWRKVDGEGKPENWELNSKTDLWFEDDWYLMEHRNFYENVYIKIMGQERKDYRGTRALPTREVFGKYLEYLTKASQFTKKEYRANNLDLDAWGVERGIWTKSITEQKQRESMTTYERFIEQWAERGREIEEKLRELRGE